MRKKDERERQRATCHALVWSTNQETEQAHKRCHNSDTLLNSLKDTKSPSQTWSNAYCNHVWVRYLWNNTSILSTHAVSKEHRTEVLIAIQKYTLWALVLLLVRKWVPTKCILLLRVSACGAYLSLSSSVLATKRSLFSTTSISWASKCASSSFSPFVFDVSMTYLMKQKWEGNKSRTTFFPIPLPTNKIHKTLITVTLAYQT